VANVSLARVKVLTVAASLLFFGFAATRAARVPLTYDEAASYIRYIDTSVPWPFDTSALSVFSFEVATNHFANTVLTKVSWLVGGGGEVWLRLPNLAAYASYLVLSVLILRPRTDPWIGLAGFALLNLNPYAIEFFSLSRGYGLSLAAIMGAMLFLLRYLEGRRVADAARALACAALAVTASFSALDLYVSITAVIVVAGAAFAGGRDGAARRRASWLWLPCAAAIFSALVFSQDVRLSDTFYAPVTVTLVGAGPQGLDRVAVIETDMRGRERRWHREPGAARWHANPGAHLRALRVEVPEDAAPGFAGLELVIGTRVFVSGPEFKGWIGRAAGGLRIFEAGPSLSAPRSRLPQFRTIMNWAGDGLYAGRVAAATASALLALAALAGLMTIAGRLLVRAGVMTSDLWRVLQSNVLWTAAFAGVPLYLLQRRGELYFGGTAGLVRDSFLSLIDRTFHERTYVAGQTQVVFALIVATLVVFCIVALVNWRRRTAVRLLPAACAIALILMASLLEVAQHVAVGSPYLIDRTALFYIPLYALFVTFLCESVAASWPAGRAVVRATLGAAVAAAALHFGATANTTSALEWPADASTKAMIADLRAATSDKPPGTRLVFGVGPFYASSAEYYIRQTTGASLDLMTLPPPGMDFFYGAEKDVPAGMDVIHTYPATRTVLARAGAAHP